MPAETAAASQPPATVKTSDSEVKETTTKDQLTALDAVVAEVRQNTGKMLEGYWNVGKAVDEIYAAQTSDAGAKKFGTNAILYVSEHAHHAVSQLYKMNQVFRRYSSEQIAQLTGAGVGITHVVDASTIVDDKERMQLLLAFGSKESEDRLTIKEFKEKVEEVAGATSNQKALKAEQQGAPGKMGAGVRAGSGQAREGSPITPVKQVFSLGEKLVEACRGSREGLKEFEADSDKQLENMILSANKAAGVSVEILKAIAKFADACEGWLANNDTDARRRRGQSGRKDAYEEVAGTLQGFVKGFDRTVAAGEKVLKEIEETEAAEEKEKASKPKAEKGKAPAKPKAPVKAKAVEKPKAVAKEVEAPPPAAAPQTAASRRIEELRLQAEKSRKKG